MPCWAALSLTVPDSSFTSLGLSVFLFFWVCSSTCSASLRVVLSRSFSLICLPASSWSNASEILLRQASLCNLTSDMPAFWYRQPSQPSVYWYLSSMALVIFILLGWASFLGSWLGMGSIGITGSKLIRTGILIPGLFGFGC